MIVRGKDCIFSIDNGDGPVPVCCARTATLTTTADLGETSTVGTGRWKTFKGLKMSYTLSAGGLVSFDLNISLALLRRIQIALSDVAFIFSATDAGGRTETFSGMMIITSIDSPFTYNANLEYSMQGQGTGELTVVG